MNQKEIYLDYVPRIPGEVGAGDADARWTFEPRQGSEATSTSKAKADGGLRIQGVSGSMSPEGKDLQCKASRDEMTLNLKAAHNF